MKVRRINYRCGMCGLAVCKSLHEPTWFCVLCMFGLTNHGYARSQYPSWARDRRQIPTPATGKKT